jgi:hypothetical protein
MRFIDEIVVHCTATSLKWYADRSAEEVVSEIRRWHTEERGWSDIGYHAVIHRNGDVAYGRPDWKKGAHVAGHNSTTIGIALVGGRGGTADEPIRRNYTAEQEASLIKLIDEYKEKYASITKITGHNTYAPKACPCFNVENWAASVGV